MENLDGLQPVGDIAGIAMTEQNYSPPLFSRDEPACQHGSVLCREIDLVKGKAKGPGGKNHLFFREIDQPGLTQEEGGAEA